MIHVIVTMGWAGIMGGSAEHPGRVGSGAPACTNTQPCGLCERQRQGILKSAGAFSFVCCSPNSFPINGSTTCLTTASAASMGLLEVAEELVWKREESSSSPIWTLGCQTQTSRYNLASISDGDVFFF